MFAYKRPLITVIFVGIVLISTRSSFAEGETSERGILGGPQGAGIPYETIEFTPASLEGGSPAAPRNTETAQENLPIIVEEGPMAASLQDPGHPSGILATRGSVIQYTVEKGDTLSGIAAEFGISVGTITAANPTIRARTLQVGQILSILPVAGALYEIHEGDTLESIAEQFGVSAARIKEANQQTSFTPIPVGVALVIPGATGVAAYSVTRASLPALPGYFAQPVQGLNWGKLHNYNAVDIANSCGVEVNAAAEGLVVDAVDGGWNGGYGHAVLVEHPNETKTRYAHLDKVTVFVGDYVKQGQKVGTIGNTGNVHGVTGCHLHFEVYGAQNPFTK